MRRKKRCYPWEPAGVSRTTTAIAAAAGEQKERRGKRLPLWWPGLRCSGRGKGGERRAPPDLQGPRNRWRAGDGISPVWDREGGEDSPPEDGRRRLGALEDLRVRMGQTFI